MLLFTKTSGGLRRRDNLPSSIPKFSREALKYHHGYSERGWGRGESFGSGTAVDAPGRRMKPARLNKRKKTQINMPYSGLQITGKKGRN